MVGVGLRVPGGEGMEPVPGDEEPKVALVVGGVCKDRDFAFYFEGNREPLRGFEQRRTVFAQSH